MNDCKIYGAGAVSGGTYRKYRLPAAEKSRVKLPRKVFPFRVQQKPWIIWTSKR